MLNVIMLSVAFYLWLNWMSICLMSLYRLSLWWVPWRHLYSPLSLSLVVDKTKIPHSQDSVKLVKIRQMLDKLVFCIIFFKFTAKSSNFTVVNFFILKKNWKNANFLGVFEINNLRTLFWQGYLLKHQSSYLKLYFCS